MIELLVFRNHCQSQRMMAKVEKLSYSMSNTLGSENRTILYEFVLCERHFCFHALVSTKVTEFARQCNKRHIKFLLVKFIYLVKAVASFLIPQNIRNKYIIWLLGRMFMYFVFLSLPTGYIKKRHRIRCWHYIWAHVKWSVDRAPLNHYAASSLSIQSMRVAIKFMVN